MSMLLNNFEDIMKAGELESSHMIDEVDPITVVNPEHKLPQIPDLAPTPQLVPESQVNEQAKEQVNEQVTMNMDDVKEALKNTNLADMIAKMSGNPSEMEKMMEKSMEYMNPDLMEQARKMAASGQGDQIVREMQRRGIDPRAMKAQIMEQQRALKGLSSKSDGTSKKAVLITQSRQLKMRNIPSAAVHASAAHLVKTPNPVELSCSRMASGALTGKSIKAWYDPSRKGKNKRASKIVGFPIAGDLLVVMDDGDLELKDFVEAEKMLA